MTTAALTGRRILLAEDDDSARTAIARALRTRGAEVIETSDGGRMLVAITSHYKAGHSPDDLDLIITDVRMPVVSGIDVFKGLRAASWKTPVVVLTAFDTPEVRDAIDRFGAVLLIKPIDLDELEAVIDDLLAGTPHTRRALL